jgi:MoaA/NifB/PqqE/SkfB family radical SAM enzyme
MDPSLGYSDDHDLTLARCKELFSEDFVRQLDKVFACGDFGDPAAAKECIPILRWFREVNPNITLGMNTNGGLRDTRFWIELGELFNCNLDYCVFSIDGMASTNDIYRRGVMWHRVMLNAETFIMSGGRAHWDMLVFEHNQHHVDHCREHARKMGFTHFRAKVSNRFEDRPVEFLSPPKGYVPIVPDGPISCHAVNEKSLYVSATGQVLPCCFIGNRIFTLDDQLKQWIQAPNYHGLADSWTTNPHEVCKRHCSTHNNQTHFSRQFTEETVLK